MCDMCSGDDEFKTQPGSPERRAMLKDKEFADILEYGHQVRMVFPREGEEGHLFWYSVGRVVMNKPEILVTGPLPPRVGQYMVNEAARMIDAGEIEIGDGTEFPPETLLTGYEVRVVRADPVASEMFGALNFVDDDPAKLEAYQLVWPDMDGNFPGDPNYDARLNQPVFPLKD